MTTSNSIRVKARNRFMMIGILASAQSVARSRDYGINYLKECTRIFMRNVAKSPHNT
jgi:hypothetical protein